MTAIGDKQHPVFINEHGKAQVCEGIIGGGGGGSSVVGSIIPYMGTDLPEGYLMCDGSEVSRTTYSELFAVIGTRFGTASDPSNFKLPKINDARYLQGNTEAGKEVEAGLPDHTHSYWKSHDQNNMHDGGHEGNNNCGGATSNTGSATDIKGIYGNSDTVTPLSITVRYLICYKKVIGKVDAMVGMPDWDTNKKVDVKQKVKDSSDLQYAVEENGYIVASNSDALGGAEVRVNGVMVWQASETGVTTQYNDFNCGVCPVSIGDIVTITRDGTKIPKSSMPGEPTLVVSFYPTKPSPVKVSELFMGAPDWDANKRVNVKAKIDDPKVTEKYWLVPEDGYILPVQHKSNVGTSKILVNEIEVWSHEDGDNEHTQGAISPIPVSKNDKVGYVDNSGSLTSIDFYPRKKIQIDVSDVAVTGSGGVIDGEMYTLSNGKTQFDAGPAYCKLDYTEAEPVYTVENDCLLAIKPIAEEIFDVNIHINDSELPVLSFRTHTTEITTKLIPIKKGSKIKIASPTSSSVKTINNLYFEEFKLHSLSPQIAMPDYKAKSIDVKAAIDASTDKRWVATENGWIFGYQNSGTNYSTSLLVDGKTAARFRHSNTYCDTLAQGPVPVSKGDVITFSNGVISECNFYPCKSVQQSHPTDCVSYVVETGKFSSVDGTTHETPSENDSWYRLYSDGWCEQGGRIVDPPTDIVDGGTYINLFKHYVDTSYVVNVSTCGYRMSDPKNASYITSCWFERSRFVAIANVNVAGFSWRAEGFVS